MLYLFFKFSFLYSSNKYNNIITYLLILLAKLQADGEQQAGGDYIVNRLISIRNIPGKTHRAGMNKI